MFYHFSPVTLFFFIMNSQIYHFNSVGDAVVTRKIFKGTNIQSQSWCESFTSKRIHWSSYFCTYCTINSLFQCNSQSDSSLVADITNLHILWRSLSLWGCKMNDLANSSLPWLSPQTTSLGCTQALVTWR